MAAFMPKITNNSTAQNQEIDVNPLLQGGRSYHLGDAKVPHLLPQPAKLKPYVDSIPGEMETWPANSNQMSTSQVKPSFLQKLEAYLNRELRILGSCSSEPSEKRLQAFREVFEYLIDDFRTYKPLLSSIKQEYEAMLTSQKETIRCLEPLKAMLVNVNEQCEQKVLNLKQDDKKDLALSKKRNNELEGVIMALKEEIVSLKQQVKKCQGEVEDVYKKYRDVSDSKKLLIQSLNDLKHQQEDAKKEGGAKETDGGDEEDCVFMRIALKKAREDLDKKNIKLAEVMADYGDVIPRRDFEKMEVQFEKTKEENETLRSDYDVLRTDHSALMDVHQKVVEQRDSFASDCERMRISATPRPDWDKCGLYIEGGQERWIEMSNSCSTNDKVDILLAEMTGQDIESIRSGVGGGIVDFFEPRGITDDVPAYLRSEETVRNRHVGKHDVLIMIKDIWQQKIKEEGNAPFTQHSLMQDYLYKYLKHNFSVENMVIEWGYNLHDALLRYSNDSNISIFRGILNGDLDEDVYYDNLSQLEGLYRLFATTDSNGQGELNREEFQNCLSSYLPNLSSDDLANLLKTAGLELNTPPDSSAVTYSGLFNVDDAGNTGPFINLVQELCKQDKEKYINEISSSLGNNTDVSMENLSETLRTIDTKITPELSQKYVELGFRGADGVKIDVRSLVSNLTRSCVRRAK